MHEHNTAFHLSFALVTPLPGIHLRDTQAKTWKAVCIVIHRGTFYNSKKLKITQMSLIGNWWLKFGTSTWGLFSCEKKWELSLHTATEWTPGYNVSEKSKPERGTWGGLPECDGGMSYRHVCSKEERAEEITNWAILNSDRAASTRFKAWH